MEMKNLNQIETNFVFEVQSIMTKIEAMNVEQIDTDYLEICRETISTMFVASLFVFIFFTIWIIPTVQEIPKTEEVVTTLEEFQPSLQEINGFLQLLKMLNRTGYKLVKI